MSVFVVIGLVTLPPDREGESTVLADAVAQTAGALPGVLSAWAAPVMRQVAINAGDVVVRMVFANAELARMGQDLRELDGLGVVWLGYPLGMHGLGTTGAGVWRALIFRCFADADPGLVSRMQAATLQLPGQIPEIRNWALSAVAWTQGAARFGWVWEQEFAQVTDLTGPYMTAPLHWGLVDAFFDADCPEYVVDPQLVQIVGATGRTIMLTA